jgi:hypothetical protein
MFLVFPSICLVNQCSWVEMGRAATLSTLHREAVFRRCIWQYLREGKDIHSASGGTKIFDQRLGLVERFVLITVESGDPD